MNDNDDNQDKEFRDFLNDVAGDQPVGESGESMDYTEFEAPEEILVDPSLFDMIPSAVSEYIDKVPEALAFADEHPFFKVYVAALLEDGWLSINMSQIADSEISKDEKLRQMNVYIESAFKKIKIPDEVDEVVKQDMIFEMKDLEEQYEEFARRILIARMLGY